MKRPGDIADANYVDVDSIPKFMVRKADLARVTLFDTLEVPEFMIQSNPPLERRKSALRVGLETTFISACKVALAFGIVGAFVFWWVATPN